MAFLISEIPSPAFRVPLAILTAVSCLAFYALERQTVSETAVSVKITFVFPSLAASAQLLSDTTNGPMALLEFQILSDIALASSLVLVLIGVITVSALDFQSVPLGTIFAKVAFVSPLSAGSAVFLLATPDRAVRFRVLVVSLRHSLLVPYSQPLLDAVFAPLSFHLQYSQKWLEFVVRGLEGGFHQTADDFVQPCQFTERE